MKNTMFSQDEEALLSSIDRLISYYIENNKTNIDSITLSLMFK